MIVIKPPSKRVAKSESEMMMAFLREKATAKFHNQLYASHVGGIQ